jgi:hypothetical protein
MVVACKNGTSPSILAHGWYGGSDVLMGPSILAYGWHGSSYVLIGPSILAYGWHGARVQEWYKSIHFRVWVAWRSSARMAKVYPFWRMGWNGGSRVMIGPSILAYGVAWRSGARIA